eukprot:s117_g8.t1
MSLTLVLSFFLVLARVQATRILESYGGTMQDVEMIGSVGNYVKEQHASDARVRDAIDEIRRNAVQLIKEIDDAAKSGSEWEFCYEGGICDLGAKLLQPTQRSPPTVPPSPLLLHKNGNHNRLDLDSPNCTADHPLLYLLQVPVVKGRSAAPGQFRQEQVPQKTLDGMGFTKIPKVCKLLAHRQAAPGDEVPKELATVALKSQEEAPELFQGGERSGKGKGGGKKGREPREEKGLTLKFLGFYYEIWGLPIGSIVAPPFVCSEDRPEKGGKDRDRRPARDSEKTEKPKRKEKDAENGSVPVETIPPVQLAEVPTELPPSARGALDLKESEEQTSQGFWGRG